MSLNAEYATSPAVQKRTVPGINANGHKPALIDTLNRLGLCPAALVPNLQKLASYGQPTKDIFQVSVYDVDRALSDVEASVSQKMAFKASLDHAGLLRVEYLERNPHTGKSISKPVP